MAIKYVFNPFTGKFDSINTGTAPSMAYPGSFGYFLAEGDTLTIQQGYYALVVNDQMTIEGDLTVDGEILEIA